MRVSVRQLAASLLFPFLTFSPTYAADMMAKVPSPAPAAPAANWTGFYVGGNAGGAWGSDPRVVRVSDRNGVEPADRGVVIGFRCAGEFR